MCGRLDQNDIDRILNDFSWVDEVIRRSQAEPCWNVAPTMRRPILRIEGAALVLEDRHWGYRSQWGRANGLGISTNARLDKIAGSYWSGLLKRGRVIVPADGWYEWTGEKPNKQPWHIHRADQAPLYMAGLACFGPDGEEPAATGFTVVTAAAEGSLLDVHDRRPVVFSAADAAMWLDPATDSKMAVQLAREASLGPDAFAWYKVDRAVGNVRNQGRHLAQPVD